MRTFSIYLLASVTVIATPAVAQEAPPAAEGENGEGSEIIVLGRGETRQVQELSTKDLTILAPGTSPLKAIEKLPSVNFQWHL